MMAKISEIDHISICFGGKNHRFPLAAPLQILFARAYSADDFHDYVKTCWPHNSAEIGQNELHRVTVMVGIDQSKRNIVEIMHNTERQLCARHVSENAAPIQLQMHVSIPEWVELTAECSSTQPGFS